MEKAVVISLRTYQRRKDPPDRKIGPEQSGRFWKFAEIHDCPGSRPAPAL